VRSAESAIPQQSVDVERQVADDRRRSTASAGDVLDTHDQSCSANDVWSQASAYACAASRAPSMWNLTSFAASSDVFPRSRATM